MARSSAILVRKPGFFKDVWYTRSHRYNGRKTESPQPFPEEMEEACRYIEKVVNEEICKRERYPLEWGGNGTDGQCWRANVAAANCYEGAKETVGFHSDQLTYLGPYPTIASLSLGMLTLRYYLYRQFYKTIGRDIPNISTSGSYSRLGSWKA